MATAPRTNLLLPGRRPPPHRPPDNLRTGGTARPRAGNPVLNGTHEELVVHHRSAVISAKVSHLKQKPRNEVWADATYAATTLRDSEVIDITPSASSSTGPQNTKTPDAKREALEEAKHPHPRHLPPEHCEACGQVYGRKVSANATS